MAETTIAPTNKSVRFRGRAQKEPTMPLQQGKSRAVVSENIAELHSGPTHARTAEKFGKQRADKQSVAIALNQARKSGRKKARAAVPRDLRARGLISDKAIAKVGDRLADETGEA